MEKGFIPQRPPAAASSAEAANSAPTRAFVGLLCATATAANASPSIELAARRVIERICAEAPWHSGRLFVALRPEHVAGGHWLVIRAGQAAAETGHGDLLTAEGPEPDGAAAAALTAGVSCCRSAAEGTVCGIPLRVGPLVLGVLELAGPGPRAPVQAELEALTEIGAQLAHVVARVGEQRGALRQQQELSHTARLASMRELARNLAHEVNQPLAAVVSYAGGALQLLEQGRADEAKLRRALEQVGVQAKRASGIIQEFREFLRREDLRHDLLDMGRLLLSTLDLLKARSRQAGVTVSVDMPPDLPPVTGDGVQLQQVLINLLENAIEAMDAPLVTERRLLITAVASDPLEIRIRDTGPGMPPDLLPRLFTPFLTTKPHGLGMGLPVSSSIVEFHGGRLSGENLPQGGMEFRIRLPVARS